MRVLTSLEMFTLNLFLIIVHISHFSLGFLFLLSFHFLPLFWILNFLTRIWHCYTSFPFRDHYSLFQVFHWISIPSPNIFSNKFVRKLNIFSICGEFLFCREGQGKDVPVIWNGINFPPNKKQILPLWFEVKQIAALKWLIIGIK